MKVNQKRLARQNEIIQKWVANNRRGTVEAVTGFGKTFVALLILQDMNAKLAGGSAIVVVPTQNLRDQWQQQINELGIHNTSVTIINTAVQHYAACDLLILDEIHNYTSPVFKTIFTVVDYRHILGLTATLERDDPRYSVIEQFAPVIDTVSLPEAIRNNYVSEFQIFNLGLRMSEEEEKRYNEITSAYYKHFALFNNRFSAAMKCMQDPVYRSVFTRNLSGWSENEVLNVARAWNRAMAARKKMLYNSPTKLAAAAALIDMFDVQTLTFGESVDFATQLTKVTQPWSEAYHSKIPKYKRADVLKRFADDKYDTRVINTARALDEGFDVKGVELAIICSGTSVSRQDLQRTGRAIRFVENKTGVIINLYLKDTQDEKWLRKRQRKSANIEWVHSLQEVRDKCHSSVRRNVAPDIVGS